MDFIKGDDDISMGAFASVFRYLCLILTFCGSRTENEPFFVTVKSSNSKSKTVTKKCNIQNKIYDNFIFKLRQHVDMYLFLESCR